MTFTHATHRDTGVIARAGAFAINLLRRVERQRRQRQEIQALMAMNDKDLRDIGLARVDVAAIAAGTFATDGRRR